MIAGARHRVLQFWRHSAGRVSARESTLAAEVLGPHLYPLFRALPRNERRHGLDVLATVDRLDRHADRLLRQAALLHDMGKAQAGLSILDRSQAVFARAISPRILDAYLRMRPNFAQRYARYRDHAGVAADRLRALDAVELAAIVDQHHDATPRNPLARRLQQADARN